MYEARKKVLVVDDDRTVREALALLLKGHFDVACACDGEDALERIGVERPDLVLLDVLMPRLDGITTLRTMRERHYRIPVIMLTANGTMREAVEAMKLGASDYLSKPFEIDELTELIIKALKGETPSTSPTQATAKNGAAVAPQEIVGSSPAIAKVREQIAQVAVRETTCLITGESGTGKELIARAIHDQSPRRRKPFIAINCSAIPETLIESELFGHEKGAFTNALERRIGHFELADKGTLLLDEIGELTLRVQVKLLRFLQEQEFCRVGNSKPLRVDVRILAATNRRLEDLVRDGKFREDLFYRINVINIIAPPLRERPGDIRELTDFFVTMLAPMYRNRKIKFSDAAWKMFEEHTWPGNVRELQNTIESLMALVSGLEVSPEDLPIKFHRQETTEPAEPPPMFAGALNFEEAQRQFETEMIVKALQQSEYVQTKAARLLGISRRILRYKMDKLGITDQAAAE